MRGVENQRRKRTCLRVGNKQNRHAARRRSHRTIGRAPNLGGELSRHDATFDATMVGAAEDAEESLLTPAEARNTERNKNNRKNGQSRPQTGARVAESHRRAGPIILFLRVGCSQFEEMLAPRDG